MKLRAKSERDEPKPDRPAKPKPVGTPAARNLALAHKLAGLIEDGTITDCTAAARLPGVSQPRLTHVMGLLLLAPSIQESILLGEIEPGDKVLRRVTGLVGWEAQVAALTAPVSDSVRRDALLPPAVAAERQTRPSRAMSAPHQRVPPASR